MATISDKKPKYEIFEKLVKSNNTSINKVALSLGIGVQTLYDWRDNKSAPKTYKMICIADYFGVDLKEFFEE